LRENVDGGNSGLYRGKGQRLIDGYSNANKGNGVIGRKIGTMDEVSGKERSRNRYVDMGAKGVLTNECLRLNSASDSGSRRVLPDGCGEWW